MNTPHLWIYQLAFTLIIIGLAVRLAREIE